MLWSDRGREFHLKGSEGSVNEKSSLAAAASRVRDSKGKCVSGRAGSS